jgi:hypothetical protein
LLAAVGLEPRAAQRLKSVAGTSVPGNRPISLWERSPPATEPSALDVRA